MNFAGKCQLVDSGSRPGKRITWFASKTGIILLISIMLVFVPVLPVVKKFTVVEEKTGKILYCTGVKPEDSFSVKYVHSVNNSPIEDVFKIQKDYGIMLDKTIFLSFGAGVPYELESGQVLNQQEDRIEIDNINKRIDEFLLRIGTVAGHTLLINGREIRLDRLTGSKQAVRFKVQRVPLFTLLETYFRGINVDEGERNATGG